MTKDELRAAYPIGARVVATAACRAQFRFRKDQPDTGQVVGYGHDEDQIRVVRDGQTTPQTFHRRFWDVIVGAPLPDMEPPP